MAWAVRPSKTRRIKIRGSVLFSRGKRRTGEYPALLLKKLVLFIFEVADVNWQRNTKTIRNRKFGPGVAIISGSLEATFRFAGAG